MCTFYPLFSPLRDLAGLSELSLVSHTRALACRHTWAVMTWFCRAHCTRTKLYLARYKSSGRRPENVNTKVKYGGPDVEWGHASVIMGGIGFVQRCIISLNYLTAHRWKLVEVERVCFFAETVKVRRTVTHCCFCVFDFPATRWKELLHVPASPAVQRG